MPQKLFHSYSEHRSPTSDFSFPNRQMSSGLEITAVGLPTTNAKKTRTKTAKQRSSNAVYARVSRERKKQQEAALEQKLRAKDALIAHLRLRITELEERASHSVEFHIELNRLISETESDTTQEDEETLPDFSLFDL